MKKFLAQKSYERSPTIKSSFKKLTLIHPHISINDILDKEEPGGRGAE